MSSLTHLLASWVIAAKTTDNPRDCRLVTLAGILPDVDGVGLVLDVANSALGCVATEREFALAAMASGKLRKHPTSNIELPTSNDRLPFVLHSRLDVGCSMFRLATSRNGVGRSAQSL